MLPSDRIIDDETPEEALVRSAKDDLKLDIDVGEPLVPNSAKHDFSAVELTTYDLAPSLRYTVNAL